MIKNFVVNVEMDERWIFHFCSFLKNLEYNSNIGHSSIIGFYADGDADFRAKFDINAEYEIQNPHKKSKMICENLYDAG